MTHEARPRRRLRMEETSDLWWKHAIMYCLDVETFLDSNADGIGDLDGLVERIDYLAGLGITCLWLMPFYPSPNRDDGYDVTDHYGVDERLGTLGQMIEVVRTARDRGIRVIADLVVNHTSVEHPWFQSARASRDSPYRDFYVWRDEPVEGIEGVMFPGEQNSTWTYDEEAGQYYLHRFYAHQPDLNVANPAVRESIHEIAGFWLQQGICGFRVDAVPFLIELMPSDDMAPHSLLRDLRAFLNRRVGDAILLGEINQAYPESSKFFGEGDELHMVFDFTLNQQLFLALARQTAEPIKRCLAGRPELPKACQWANFVTNHDELTLDQLSAEEREEVFRAFAPEDGMRIYDRGIRRRLPSMLEGDMRRIRLVYSFLLATPGTPILYYGEEIGMGENLEVARRRAVRTPMQWTAEQNGGFSEASPEALVRPLTEGELGPEKVNVAHQRRTSDSLLDWLERLMRRRRECPEFGFGEASMLETGDERILGVCCAWQGSTLIALHNFGAHDLVARLELALPDDFDGFAEVLADGSYEEPSSCEVPLAAFGHRWLRMRHKGRRPPL